MLRDILIGVLVGLALHHITKKAGGCGCQGARVLPFPQAEPATIVSPCAKKPMAPVGDFSQSTGPGPMRRY